MGDFESESSSSDGENAGEVKNVARLVMRPPGHSGKAKKGHLVFDASFEGGNLGRVDYVGELDYDLYVRPDVANPRHRVWFNFTVENVRVDQRVVFTFVNFSKVLLLFHEGFTPVVKSTSRPQWVRIPSKCVFYYRCPEHGNRYVLSIVFAFDKEDDVYHFAFSYPYSYSRLQKYLENLEAQQLPYFKREKIGETLHGRLLDMITIESPSKQTDEKEKISPNNPQSKTKKRKTVIVGARIHPGETPSSYVCQGMINFLLSSHPVAEILRENVRFKFIPMLNPDGVYVGNYRTCILGQDLNRCWQEKSIHAYPSLAAVKHITESVSSEKEGEIDMYLDLHAHTGQLGAFVYGNSYNDVYRFQRHTLFPKHLSYCAQDFSLEHTVYNKDRNKSGTSRRFLSTFLNDKVNCYTLEVSFHGYEVPRGNSTAVTVYNEEEYLQLGKKICYSLLDYYCTTKYIPPEEIPSAIRDTYCKGFRAKLSSNVNTKSPHKVPPAASKDRKIGSQAASTKGSKVKSTKAKNIPSTIKETNLSASTKKVQNI